MVRRVPGPVEDVQEGPGSQSEAEHGLQCWAGAPAMGPQTPAPGQTPHMYTQRVGFTAYLRLFNRNNISLDY